MGREACRYQQSGIPHEQRYESGIGIKSRYAGISGRILFAFHAEIGTYKFQIIHHILQRHAQR